MANRTKIIPLIHLITLATGLLIGGGVSASVVEVSDKTPAVIGHAPVVSDVTFDKTTPAVNDKVTATPTITDADNDTLESSLYQWQLDGVDISGATQDSYTLVPGDGNGKQLTVKVTPQTDPAITEPASGTAVTSSPLTTRGLAPEALNVKIEGTPKSGQTLTGHYHYNDRDIDPEDISLNGTQFEWICSRSDGRKENLAWTTTYTLQDVDGGCAISFSVTPHALSGTPRIGAQVQSMKVDVPKATSSPIIRLSRGAKIGEFNMEIDYAHLDSGEPTHISLFEFRVKSSAPGRSYGYDIGQETNSRSTVTDNGRTIQFEAISSYRKEVIEGKNPSISFEVTLNFKNGIKVWGRSPELELK
uniref:Uncharacterized protein n=1 Tax=Providencia stuartii TaxID=588 RepID=A0AAI9GGM3_PROST|nr:hypothetical protein [Providencia stuartii]